MQSFSQTWAALVTKFRWAIIGLSLVFAALAPLSFDRLYYDSSNEAYFIENDPNILAFDQLLEYFGDTEYLVIGVEARPGDKDIFNADSLTMIHEMSEFLEEHEHVTQVRSLSKYQYTHDANGIMSTDDVFESIDDYIENPALFEQARKIMADEALAMGILVSEDFQHTRIAARAEYIKNENAHNVKLVTELIAFIEQQGYEQEGFDLKLSGVPVIAERFETMTKSDQAILNPAMGVLMMIILFIVFRMIFATLVPIVIILATLFYLTSIQGLLAYPNTAVSSALIPTMIILCMGACVHVLVEFFQARRNGLTPKDAATDTTRDLFFAILFTSLTTAVGFIALSVTDLRPVRQFSILAAIGPMIIFILATTTLPAILSFVPWIPRIKAESGPKRMEVWLSQSLPQFTFKYRKSIALTGLIIALFSLYSIQHIRVDTNVVNYFKSNHWVNEDLHYFNEHFKGISNLEVIVDTGYEGGVKDPEILRRVDALQHYLESFPESGNATSVLDFYKQINQSLNADNPEHFRLPTSPEMAAQFLLLYENTGPDEDLSDFKDFDQRYLRILVPIINMDESQQTQILSSIKSTIALDYPDLDILLTGSLVMNNAQNVYVNNGMFQSFGIAIVVIGLCFLVLFRSLKYGVIALVPSLVPVILTGGLITYYGISLDLGTMIVGAMTIGIAVDDSIHIMSRYRLRRRLGDTVHNAISTALSTSGRAVILTSIILVTGFSVMLFGNFVPFIYVGLFSAMIMLFALIGDLFFMPALLYIVDGKASEHESAISQESTSKRSTSKRSTPNLSKPKLSKPKLSTLPKLEEQ